MGAVVSTEPESCNEALGTPSIPVPKEHPVQAVRVTAQPLLLPSRLCVLVMMERVLFMWWEASPDARCTRPRTKRPKRLRSFASHFCGSVKTSLLPPETCLLTGVRIRLPLPPTVRLVERVAIKVELPHLRTLMRKARFLLP